MPTAVPSPSSSSSAAPTRPAQPAPARAARSTASRQAAQQQQQQQQQQQHTPSSSSASASSSSRLPAAPSSLRVQLPSSAAQPQVTPRSPPTLLRSPPRPSNESDLLTSVLTRRRPSQQQPIPAVPPTSASASTSTTTPSPATQPPVPSDVSLLASSLLTQRAKSQAIAAAQEYLIFPPSSGARTREELKRSLTRLAVPHWLQVNQERSLAGLCGYPCCPNPLPARTAQRGGAGARLRISVARGVIERDTRDEPGGRNGFCSDVCHARGEWVRRWVLSDEDAVEDEGPARRRAAAAGQDGEGQQSSSFFSGDDLVDGLRASIASGNIARNGDSGSGGLRALGTASALQGGKWEALTRRKEEDWREIELLEDLQERGDLEEWEGFEADDGDEEGEDATVASRSAVEGEEDAAVAAAAAERSFQAATATPTALPREEPAVAAATALARDADSLPFDDLVISERQHGAAPPSVEEERVQVQAAAAAVAAEEDEESEEEEEEEEMSEEQKMIEEAMRLREEIKGRGEWVE